MSLYNTSVRKYTPISDNNPISGETGSQPKKSYCESMREFFKKHEDTIGFSIACILLGILGLLLLYAIIILLSLLCVYFNIIFENTMVSIIGRDLYNKNFPVCSNTRYAGNDCYTTTNVYCS